MIKKIIYQPIQLKIIKSCVLLCTFLCISTLLIAQSYQNKKISFTGVNMEVSKVLDAIAPMAGVKFFYQHTDIDANRRIGIKVVNEPLDFVLKQIFRGKNISIEYQPKGVIVLKPQRIDKKAEKKRLVSGKVFDKKTKEPLLGVSIIWQNNRAQGTSSDVEGNFRMEIPYDVPALEVSYIGYKPYLLKIVDSPMDNIVIALESDIIDIGEVVVTGIRKRTTESFTGDYTRVKGEDLLKTNPNNLLEALELFDPSFRVVENTQRGSDPNALPEFRMRGDVQLGNGVELDNMDMVLAGYASLPNMPLFVLDGFPVSIQRIIDLNPERIKEVVILKDAAAASIYGSKAANGVIVFETKPPIPGKINFTYYNGLSVSIPDLRDYNLMDAKEKLEAEKLAGLYDENNALQMNTYNRYKSEILKGVNSYWLSQPLRTAIMQRHTLSMEGGDDALRYRLGVNYTNTPGVMKGSDRSNTGLDFTLTYRRDKLNISNNLTLNNNESNNSPYGSFSEYTRINPYYRIYAANGRYKDILDSKFTQVGVGKTRIANPLYNTQFASKDFSKSFSVTNNLALEYSILENFRISANLSYTRNEAKTERFTSPNHTKYDAETGLDLVKRGEYIKNMGNSSSWDTNLSLDYNFSKEKHVLSTFARVDISSSSGETVNLTARGYPNDQMNDFLFGFEMPNRISGGDSQSRSLGMMGQLSYMYDFKYSIDLNLRTDLSSDFGVDNRLAPFWSVGARWNANKESWFDSRWGSSLLFRASYGVTGSQNYSPYQALRSYTYETFMHPYVSSDVIGAVLMGIGNSNLGWSTTNNLNFGLEWASPENRFRVSYNYYHNYTNKLLIDFTLAPSVGFSSMTDNAGAILNEGHQFDISVIPYRNDEKNIQWLMSLSGTTNKNRIENISNTLAKQNEANLKNPNAPLPIYVEGEPTTRIFLVRSLGIDPATGQEVYLDRDNNKTFVWNAKDKVPVGNSAAKWRGNITNSFNYKNLNLAFAFQYSLGADVYNGTLMNKIENANLAYNADKRALTERWTPDNRNALYKGMVINGNPQIGNYTNASTRFLQKQNELRFTSISLGYRMEAKTHSFLKKFAISTMSLGANIQNLARISNIKNERGLDYPFAQSFSLSLSLTF